MNDVKTRVRSCLKDVCGVEIGDFYTRGLGRPLRLEIRCDYKSSQLFGQSSTRKHHYVTLGPVIELTATAAVTCGNEDWTKTHVFCRTLALYIRIRR